MIPCREQCVWAVGNIAGDSTVLRDLVIDKGIADSIEAILSQASLAVDGDAGKISTTLLRNAVWCASNIFRGKPKPSFDKLESLLKSMIALVNIKDMEVGICETCMICIRSCPCDIFVLLFSCSGED